MNSEVDQELTEWQSSEGCDQRIRIQLEACSQWCYPSSLLGPVLFNLFINNLEKGKECKGPSASVLSS